MVKVFDIWCPKALWRSFAALTAALLFMPAVVTAQSGGRPNIVFIMTDDHAAHAIGAYGSRVNTTPNLDRLAREGALLTRCSRRTRSARPAAPRS